MHHIVLLLCHFVTSFYRDQIIAGSGDLDIALSYVAIFIILQLIVQPLTHILCFGGIPNMNDRICLLQYADLVKKKPN